MCLLSKTKEPLIAEENIVCYKVLQRLDENHYVSPFRNVKYKINDFNYPSEKYNMDNMKKPCNNYYLDDFLTYRIEQGFLHCFTQQGVLPYNLYKGSLYMLAHLLPLYVFECYIPKGAKYFISRCGKEICSNKLFVKDFKKPFT